MKKAWKLLAGIMLGCLCATWGMARDISPDEAARAVSKWMKGDETPLGARSIAGSSVSDVETKTDEDGNALYHVVHLESGAVIVTSAESGIQPVVAFSDGDNVDESSDNPIWDILQADMRGRLGLVACERAKKRSAKGAQSGGAEWIDENEAAWNELLQTKQARDGRQEKLSDIRVPRLTQTSWGQMHDVFNYSTPENNPVGCVATAMSQLMRFHEYPSGNVAPVTRVCWTNDEETVWRVNLTTKGGTYDWNNMPLNPENVNLTVAQKKAIGKLCSDAGISVYMNYGPSGSSTQTALATEALTNVWQFASAILFHRWPDMSITTSELKNTAFANFDAGFPVILGISTGTSQSDFGHSLLGDGYGFYGSTAYTHLNMGQYGEYDDYWYNLPTIDLGPGEPVFRLFTRIIYNIFPVQKGILITGRVLDSSGNPIQGATVSGVKGNIQVNGTSNGRGIYSLLVTSPGTYSVSATLGTSTSPSKQVTVANCVSGTYEFNQYANPWGNNYEELTTGSIGNSWGNDLTLNGGSTVTLKTALDNSTLTFTTGGDASWFGQTKTTHDGVDAAQSGDIGDSQNSWMKTTVTGAGTIRFWWNTSCETNVSCAFDCLEFLVDGVQKAAICGVDRSWVRVGVSVTGSGQHELKWNYHKDGSASYGDDCGWVDQVVWEPLVESKQTVKFNANGGKCGTATKIYTVGGSYSGFPVATKSGAVFLGWWTAKSGGVRVDDGDAVTSATTRPLYAHWTTKQSVMFNAMGGSCGTSTKSYTVATTYGSLPKATWAGHAFLGWWTEQNGGTKVTASSKVPYQASRQLFAHWTTLQTVKFDANGGSCATASKGCTIGGPYLNLPTPTKSGRAFTGWFTEKSGGKKIVQGTTIATEAATRTFYAHWTKTQTAKFNANGGTCKTASKTYTIGSAYGSLPAAKKSGYGHAGWYTAASGGTLVEKTSKVTQEVTRQLYAQWTTIQTVKFDANGGSCATVSKGCTIGSPYLNLPVATKSGVAFGGWWTAKTGGTKVVEGTTTVTESAKRTLYAHWTKTQTVKFNANGGTCTTASKKCTVGKTYGSLPAAKKSGYGHAGWYTAASGGTLVESTSKVTETAARTLYAHWTTLQMVQFDANGGSCGTPSKGCTIGGPYLNLPVPTKSGRAFTGWFTAKSGGKKIVEGTTTVTESATRTLYAHWTKTQTVKFNANGGKCKTASKTYTVGTTYGSFPVASWTNHEFKGWATAASGGSLVAATSKVTAEMTRNLWARWSTAQTVTFDANGGTCATATKNYTMGGTYGSFPTATLDGFALEGWYTSRTAGTKVEVGALVPGTPTRTLYAHWTTKQIVTFDATGGTSPVKTKTFTVGGVYTNLPTPTWAGHAFLGWYSAKENGSLLPEGRKVGALAERTLYAYWTTKQTVTFDANGGTCGTSTKEYTIGQPYGSLPTATLDGFALQGWYTSKTGGTKVVKEDGVTAAEKRKLYARWTDRQVVTFDPRGGTCSVKTKTYTVGGTYTNLPVPTWSGHTFLGWYSEPTNGSRLPEGRKVGALAERTLYAYWSTGTKGLAFSGISVDAPSRVPAIRSANNTPAGTDSCTLRIAAPADRLCRVQWTPSLDGEWTTLLEWTPESDGETDVPVRIPDTTGIGFFRLVIDQE